MPRVKIITTNESDGSSKLIRAFDNSAPYEGLKPSDIVELEVDDVGTLEEYFVEEMKWDFTHFGDTLVIHIKPLKLKPITKSPTDWV